MTTFIVINPRFLWLKSFRTITQCNCVQKGHLKLMPLTEYVTDIQSMNPWSLKFNNLPNIASKQSFPTAILHTLILWLCLWVNILCSLIKNYESKHECNRRHANFTVEQMGICHVWEMKLNPAQPDWQPDRWIIKLTFQLLWTSAWFFCGT